MRKECVLQLIHFGVHVLRFQEIAVIKNGEAHVDSQSVIRRQRG